MANFLGHINSQVLNVTNDLTPSEVDEKRKLKSFVERIQSNIRIVIVAAGVFAIIYLS